MGVLYENLQKTSNGLSTSADSYETGKTTNKVHMIFILRGYENWIISLKCV